MFHTFRTVRNGIDTTKYFVDVFSFRFSKLRWVFKTSVVTENSAN